MRTSHNLLVYITDMDPDDLWTTERLIEAFEEELGCLLEYNPELGLLSLYTTIIVEPAELSDAALRQMLHRIRHLVGRFLQDYRLLFSVSARSNASDSRPLGRILACSPYDRLLHQVIAPEYPRILPLPETSSSVSGSRSLRIDGAGLTRP